MRPIYILLSLLLFPFFASSQSVVQLERKQVRYHLAVDQEVENWNHSFAAFNRLSPREQEILYWTNFARKNSKRFWDSVMVPVLANFPQLRGSYANSLQQDLTTSSPLPMFGLNDTLLRTSKAHALDISTKNANVSHTSTDGTTFSERLQKAGVVNCGSENMSLGGGDVILSIAMLYLDYGLEDLGHRKTLLNPDYIYIGVGATLYGKGQLFFVQDFACNQQ